MVVPFSGGCNTLGVCGGPLSPNVPLFKIFVQFFWPPPQILEIRPINWHRCVTICNLKCCIFLLFFFYGPVSWDMAVRKICHFGPTDELSIYTMKGRQFWCHVIWEFVGDLLPTKSHLLTISAINGFLVNWWDVKLCKIFFNGPLHILCLGCEVETDMSGQSNHWLRVCNVKWKKNDRGGNVPHFRELFFTGPPHISCLGWEVGANMSGQSNDGLGVHNVKMKKFLPGQKQGAFTCIYQLRGPSINRFEFFHRRTPGLGGSSCCEDFLAKIN